MSYIEENGYFIFGDVKSSDYGVWISGGGTFNAPARRYKEYVVPGRNGTLTIDEGAYEEAEVTYPAFIARDFPANVEAFRNAIMAQNGYVRMTDSYHPDEFCLARYMAGLEVDTLPGGRGGSFELTFKRDPRRFLLSGENVITYQEGMNYLPYPYHGETFGSGIQWTDNGDGTITASGEATDGQSGYFLIKEDMLPMVAGGKYKITGGLSSNMWLLLHSNGGSQINLFDTGNGIIFTYPGDSESYNLTIAIRENTVLSNPVTFSPKIYALDYKINNPTQFPSKPLIRVTGSGTVSIGDNTITIASGYTYVDIDSEIQDCYCGTQNANSLVTFSNRKFPELQPGINGISLGTGVTSVQITPRWFIL